MNNLKSFQFLTVILFTAFIFSGTGLIQAQNSLEGKVLLAVFAHPDDERRISPIMAKYTRQGAKVYLVIATDGRYGVNDHSGLKAGDGLVAIRKEEMKCAASKIGVELIHLNYHDQLRANEGYDGHIPHIRALIKELDGIVERVKPDAIITWGPDGGTNHMDHRLVGASVTQVYLNKKREKPMSLYYYGIPSEEITSEEQKMLIGVDIKYLKTKVGFEKQDYERALSSLACHVSQVNEEGMEKFRKQNGKEGTVIYLRKLLVPNKVSNTIF